MSVIGAWRINRSIGSRAMHLGLVTFEHAQTWGITRQAWARALEDRTVELVHRDVARMYGTSTAIEQRILAAVLAAGPRCDGVASVIGACLGRRTI